MFFFLFFYDSYGPPYKTLRIAAVHGCKISAYLRQYYKCQYRYLPKLQMKLNSGFKK